MAVTGHFGGTSPPAEGETATTKAVANKLRELELKVAGLDNNQVEGDDIDTETALQEMER
jgi:hypothetical protein